MLPVAFAKFKKLAFSNPAPFMVPLFAVSETELAFIEPLTETLDPEMFRLEVLEPDIVPALTEAPTEIARVLLLSVIVLALLKMLLAPASS